MARDPGTVLTVYADDTSCRKEGFAFRRLQRFLDEAVDWFGWWHFCVNVEKSIAIWFTRKTTPPYDSLSLAGRCLPWLPVTKYLGVYLLA